MQIAAVAQGDVRLLSRRRHYGEEQAAASLAGAEDFQERGR